MIGHDRPSIYLFLSLHGENSTQIHDLKTKFQIHHPSILLEDGTLN